MNGALANCINITERGNTELTIQGNTLKSGVYAYVIIADNIASETKQMILTR